MSEKKPWWSWEAGDSRAVAIAVTTAKAAAAGAGRLRVYMVYL
jgi:hypothetical protein